MTMATASTLRNITASSPNILTRQPRATGALLRLHRQALHNMPWITARKRKERTRLAHSTSLPEAMLPWAVSRREVVSSVLPSPPCLVTEDIRNRTWPKPLRTVPLSRNTAFRSRLHQALVATKLQSHTTLHPGHRPPLGEWPVSLLASRRCSWAVELEQAYSSHSNFRLKPGPGR
jgi:hypothetical protein